MVTLLMVATSLAGESALQVGLTAPYAVMPGIRVGRRTPLRPPASPDRSTTVVYGADIAAYVDPGDHVSGLVAPAVGLRWLRPSGLGVTVEAGLAIVVDRQTLSVTVDLGSGGRSQGREWRLWLVPSVGGRLSWRNQRRFGGYAGLSAGQEIGFSRDGAFVFTLDAGVRVRLGQGSSQ